MAALGLGALAPLAAAHAQVVPQEALDQLDTLIGNRVETLSVLGTQSGASGGTYLSNVNDTAVDVFKVTGRGDKVEWLGIGAGYFWGENFSGWTVGADIRLKF